jgi:hypothetical protein
MSKAIIEIYDALKIAGVPEDKATAAAKAVAEVGQEDRLARIKADIKVIKWMMGVLIAMNIGIILMLIKVLSAMPR